MPTYSSNTNILSFRSMHENGISTGINITINEDTMDGVVDDLLECEYDSLDVDRFDCPVRDKKLKHYIAKRKNGELCCTVNGEISDRLYNDLIDDYDHIAKTLMEGEWSQPDYFEDRYDKYAFFDTFVEICEQCDCDGCQETKYKFGEKVNYDDSDTDTDSPTFITCSICLFKRDTSDDQNPMYEDTRCCRV